MVGHTSYVHLGKVDLYFYMVRQLIHKSDHVRHMTYMIDLEMLLKCLLVATATHVYHNPC